MLFSGVGVGVRVGAGAGQNIFRSGSIQKSRIRAAPATLQTRITFCP